MKQELVKTMRTFKMRTKAKTDMFKAERGVFEMGTASAMLQIKNQDFLPDGFYRVDTYMKHPKETALIRQSCARWEQPFDTEGITWQTLTAEQRSDVATLAAACDKNMRFEHDCLMFAKGWLSISTRYFALGIPMQTPAREDIQVEGCVASSYDNAMLYYLADAERYGFTPDLRYIYITTGDLTVRLSLKLIYRENRSLLFNGEGTAAVDLVDPSAEIEARKGVDNGERTFEIGAYKTDIFALSAVWGLGVRGVSMYMNYCGKFLLGNNIVGLLVLRKKE